MSIMNDCYNAWNKGVPNSWELRPMKHSHNVYAGATPKSDNADYWNGDIPWITPADYKTVDVTVCEGKKSITRKGYESCSTVLVPENSLIISKRAPIGTVAISGKTLCTNQASFIVPV